MIPDHATKRALALIIYGQIIEAAVHHYSMDVGTQVVNQTYADYSGGDAFSPAEKSILQQMATAAKERIARGEKDPRASLKRVTTKVTAGV